MTVAETGDVAFTEIAGCRAMYRLAAIAGSMMVARAYRLIRSHDRSLLIKPLALAACALSSCYGAFWAAFYFDLVAVVAARRQYLGAFLCALFQSLSLPFAFSCTVF